MRRVEPGTTHSILIVEDDPDITTALQDLLEFEGFHVDWAQSCHQASYPSNKMFTTPFSSILDSLTEMVARFWKRFMFLIPRFP